MVSSIVGLAARRLSYKWINGQKGGSVTLIKTKAVGSAGQTCPTARDALNDSSTEVEN